MFRRRYVKGIFGRPLLLSSAKSVSPYTALRPWRTNLNPPLCL